MTFPWLLAAVCLEHIRAERGGSRRRHECMLVAVDGVSLVDLRAACF